MIHDADTLKNRAAQFALSRDNITVFDLYRSRRWFIKPDHVFEKCRFAASRPAEYDELFALVDVEIEIIQHDAALESRRKISDFNYDIVIHALNPKGE